MFNIHIFCKRPDILVLRALCCLCCNLSTLLLYPKQPQTTHSKCLYSGRHQHLKPVIQLLGPPRSHSQDAVTTQHDCCCFTMTLRVSPEMISEWFSLAGLGPSLLGQSQLHLLRPSSPSANLFRAEADSHLFPDLAQCLDISQKIFNMLPPQVSNYPIHHYWRQKPSNPVPAFQISSNIL